MANPQAQRYAQQATYALQQGELAQALSFIEQAIAIDTASADSHIIRGVILAQLRQPDEAANAFAEAIRLAPNDPRGYYNLAVHYNGLGRTTEALDLARKVLTLDPRHTAAASLVRQLEAGPTFQTPTMSPPPEIRAGFSEPEAGGSMPSHLRDPRSKGIGFVRALGSAWDMAGWLLAATGAVAFFYIVSRLTKTIADLGDLKLSVFDMSERVNLILQTDPQYRTVTLLAMIVAVVSVLWLILDILDKRASALWAAPGIICCLCWSPWLILPFYITMGRK